MSHIQNASETARAAGERVAGAARQTADRVADAAEHYAERAQHAGEDLQRHADEGVKVARSFVQEQPLASLGIAVLVGMIAVSLILRR